MYLASDEIKVLMTTVPPEAGGGIANLHQVIAEHNNCLDLVFTAAASRLPFAESVMKRVTRAMAQPFKLRHLLRKNPSIRLVHVNTAPDTKAILRDSMIVLAARLSARKVVVQIHGGIGDYQRPLVVNLLAKAVLRLSHSILVLSMKDKNAIDSLGLKVRCQVIANAVVVEDFQPGSGQGRGTKSEVVVLFLSRLIAEKGVYELMTAIDSVVKVFPAVRFVFAGDGPEREKMENICRNKGIERWVCFTGYLGYDDVVRCYRSADIFVLPSHSEAMPMTVLQALAAGLPIVSTRCGAVPEILREKRNALFVDMKDPSQLAEKILTLLRDESLRRQMGKANLQLAWKSYDINVLTARLSELYSSLA